LLIEFLDSLELTEAYTVCENVRLVWNVDNTTDIEPDRFKVQVTFDSDNRTLDWPGILNFFLFSFNKSNNNKNKKKELTFNNASYTIKFIFNLNSQLQESLL
jgi:hypothetical protein